MGLVHGGELFDVIHTEQDGVWSSGIPEGDAKFYAMVLTDTLDYMHRKQLVYRDLKPGELQNDNNNNNALLSIHILYLFSHHSFPIYVTRECIN